MNKLSDALKIIQTMGWTEEFSPKALEAFRFLEQEARNLSNEELCEAEWDIVKLVDRLLIEKGGKQMPPALNNKLN